MNNCLEASLRRELTFVEEDGKESFPFPYSSAKVKSPRRLTWKLPSTVLESNRIFTKLLQFSAAK